MLKNVNRKEVVFIVSLLIIIGILVMFPTGFQKQEYNYTQGVRARVISVNNIGIQNSGIYKLGDQSALIEIETGSHKGEEIQANNILTGRLSTDKIFKEGDKAWVLIGYDEEGLCSNYQRNDLFYCYMFSCWNLRLPLSDTRSCNGGC